MKTGEWILFLLLCLLVAISCDVPPIQEDVHLEPERAEGAIQITVDGSQIDYNQIVYLDTIANYTYTRIYVESTDMAEHQKYNGQSNIYARFSTDKYWNLSGGVFDNYPVYYVYPFGVRLIPPANHHRYRPSTFPLWSQQLVGPIPKEAIINNEEIKIMVNVDYDGEYEVKDSLLIKLRVR